MFINIFNKVSTKNRKSSNGVVTFDAVIAKAKIHKLHNSEIIVPDDFKDLEFIDCMYPKEVFKNSLESLSFLPVTNDHPFMLIMDMEDKNMANKYLGKGITSEATINSDGEIQTKVSIFDAEMVTDIMNDKVELSWGGKVQYNWLSKEEAKEKGYQLELKNEIIGDHLSLVDYGRCEGDCKIKFDTEKSTNTSFKDENKAVVKTMLNAIKNTTKTDKSKKSKIEPQNKQKGKKMDISLNGKTLKVDEEVGNLVNDAIGALNGKVNALEKENTELQKANDELQVIKATARFEDVINKAKEMDEDFEVEDKEKATLLSVINTVMATDEKDESRAYSAFNAVYNFYVTRKKDATIVQVNANKEVKTASHALDSVYDDIFGGTK